MSEIIFHHYPQSPASEKVRVVFGIKDLDWHSVEIPRLPPRPDVLPLTGGYRRTPVMQIGADIYCDTRCIIGEVEHRYPTPTLFPDGDAGVAWGTNHWTDLLFTLMAAVMFGEKGESLPQEFARDRGRLYFGPRFALASLKNDLPHNTAQLRVQLGWIERTLGDGRRFLCGDLPALADALCYHIVWFVRGRLDRGPGLLAALPRLSDWEGRVRGIGHGRPRDRTPQQALDAALAARPDLTEIEDPGDPQGPRPGLDVSVVPEGIGGDPRVCGRLVALTPETVAIARGDDRVGEVVVHFPRVGYRVDLA